MTFNLAAMDSGYDLREFCDGDDDLSSCPCFTLNRPGLQARGKCWRTAHDNHAYDSRKSDGGCCVHVWGSAEDGERLRDLLDKMNWCGGWALVMESGQMPYAE